MAEGDKTHAELGASGADRWMECPGSIALSRGIEDPGSEYTRLGTAAHALAERAFKEWADPVKWIGETINDIEVDEDMVDAVTVFYNMVVDRQLPDDIIWIERKFNLAALHPPAPMFGTPDIIMYSPSRRTLYVDDYKHGVGYAVAAKGNRQVRYYALGSLLEIEREIGPGTIDWVEVTICQPRAAHPDGIIRSERMEYETIVEFAGELLAAAHLAMQPNAPLKAGGHCRFCRASAICPAQQARAMEIAQMEFADEDTPAPVTALSQETILKVLAHKDELEKWLKDIERHVFMELERGRPVEGWKLVRKKTNRKWISEEGTIQWLTDYGLKPDEFNDPPSLKSPAGIEKIVGKKSLAETLWEKPEGGLTLAPVYDPRPAASLGPDTEFPD
jgi:hypothetical protein